MRRTEQGNLLGQWVRWMAASKLEQDPYSRLRFPPPLHCTSIRLEQLNAKTNTLDYSRQMYFFFLFNYIDTNTQKFVLPPPLPLAALHCNQIKVIESRRRLPRCLLLYSSNQVQPPWLGLSPSFSLAYILMHKPLQG